MLSCPRISSCLRDLLMNTMENYLPLFFSLSLSSLFSLTVALSSPKKCNWKMTIQISLQNTVLSIREVTNLAYFLNHSFFFIFHRSYLPQECRWEAISKVISRHWNKLFHIFLSWDYTWGKGTHSSLQTCWQCHFKCSATRGNWKYKVYYPQRCCVF